MIDIKKLLGVGNAVDRYSILKMKEFRGKDYPPEEIKVIREYIMQECPNADYVLAGIDLAVANANTWELESRMREGKENNDYESIGKASMRIRESNAQRVKAINELNKLTNTGCIDLKINHISGLKK